MRSTIVKTALHFGSASCLNRYPRGCTGHVAHPIRSIRRYTKTIEGFLPAKNFREDQWRDNRSVGFDNESRRRGAKFAPGDFFIGHRAGIRPVARGGIADLTEVAPLRHNFADDVLVEHRHDANREVAGDAAADLKKADRRTLALTAVPLRQLDHVFDARARGVPLRDLAC